MRCIVKLSLASDWHLKIACFNFSPKIAEKSRLIIKVVPATIIGAFLLICLPTCISIILVTLRRKQCCHRRDQVHCDSQFCIIYIKLIWILLRIDNFFYTLCRLNQYFQDSLIKVGSKVSNIKSMTTLIDKLTVKNTQPHVSKN